MIKRTVAPMWDFWLSPGRHVLAVSQDYLCLAAPKLQLGAVCLSSQYTSLILLCPTWPLASSLTYPPLQRMQYTHSLKRHSTNKVHIHTHTRTLFASVCFGRGPKFINAVDIYNKKWPLCSTQYELLPQVTHIHKFILFKLGQNILALYIMQPDICIHYIHLNFYICTSYCDDIL